MSQSSITTNGSNENGSRGVSSQELKQLAALSKRTDKYGTGAFENYLAALTMRYQMTFREAQDCIDAGRLLLAAEAGQR